MSVEVELPSAVIDATIVGLEAQFPTVDAEWQDLVNTDSTPDTLSRLRTINTAIGWTVAREQVVPEFVYSKVDELFTELGRHEPRLLKRNTLQTP